ncbi:MAPEG family protein [Hoeflea sp. TYP-13]|uniref:MAPEG family protein n=1 Tax=Hoeflea sp. TYP-13 TaxID=3230023 RepID=UPI0034C62BAA
MVEALAPYGGSIIGLMITGIIILVLTPAVAAKKAGADIKPGSEPANDYGDTNYRLHRTHMNAVENYAQFAIPTMFAMLLGASATWVAILVWATVVVRLLYTFVYLQNIGKPAQSVRSFTYVAGWVLNIAMVFVVIIAVL